MTRGMIVAPQPEAVEAGWRAFKDGGNAIDAAIACALMQTVVDPLMSGICGCGSLQLYLPGRGVHRMIDFHGRAPAAARDDMWADQIVRENPGGFGFAVTGRANDIGYRSITVPASLAAYHTAVSQFGQLPWGRLLEDPIRVADGGFPIRPHMYGWWTLAEDNGRALPVERLAFSVTGRRTYLDAADAPRKPGQILRNPDMARTLKRIAEGGVEVFYRGEIAREIDADMGRNGGLLSLQDMETCTPDVGEPLWGTYRGHRISTNPLPGGGIIVLQMLNILEHFDLPAIGHNTPEYIRVVAEVMKRAMIDKQAHVGDPKFVDVPMDRLLSQDYARTHAEAIKDGDMAVVPEFKGGVESKDTTHISAVDGEGNAVAMTHTLGVPSGVITDGLGVMYTGSMSLFDPRPGRPGSIAPGKARPTSMAPSIVFKGDDPFLVLGAPGGAHIAMAILQGILNCVDFGMSAIEAVSAPRFSSPGNALHVVNRIPRAVTDPLEAKGYRVVRNHKSYDYAAVHLIKIEDGRWSGAADPSRDGMALEA